MDFKVFNLENPFGGEKNYEQLQNLEEEYMPAEGYFNNFNSSTREQVYFTIFQYSDPGLPTSAYLAMTYFDRYNSRQPISDGPSTANIGIIAISCLILAEKMTNSEFSVAQFLSRNNLEMDTSEIWETEFKILDELKWKMRSITPLCFLDWFIPMFGLMDESTAQGFKTRAVSIIVISYKSIKLTRYRPSLIAPCALLETMSTQTIMALSQYMDKATLFQCNLDIGTELQLNLMTLYATEEQQRFNEGTSSFAPSTSSASGNE